MENQQKTALITGGTSGIGKELAKLFAKDNYNLIIVARDQGELDSTAGELGASGIQVETISKDLSNMDEAFALCQELGNRQIDTIRSTCDQAGPIREAVTRRRVGVQGHNAPGGIISIG